ncbi:MAG: hypothetical protein JOZ69_03320 [Myxococcales bacterium]|nr:hypothetical protein [Myxococcales bacterium]
MNRWGPRVVVSLGMLLSAVGIGGVGLLAAHASGAGVAALLFSSGVGVGLMTGPVSQIPIASAPRERSGVTSGAVNVARMLGATMGVAIVGAFLGAHGQGPTAATLEHGMRVLLLLGASSHGAGALLAAAAIRRHALDGTA